MLLKWVSLSINIYIYLHPSSLKSGFVGVDIGK